jgi:hypothetical protein
MKFRAGDLEFNANVAESSEAPSPQTGDLLRALTIQFRAQKISMHEQALEQAQQRQSGGLFSLTDANEPELEWRVREFSSSYVGSEPWGINHHVWQIEQVERLACERLLVGPIELEPYEYVEEVSEERQVRLAARALISDVDLQRLAELTGVIAVVRVGISDTPRQMQLQYVWGERPEGLAVALACRDAVEPRVTLQGAFAVTDAVDLLITALRTKGILDEVDMHTLRQHQHASRRVANIDSWSL